MSKRLSNVLKNVIQEDSNSRCTQLEKLEKARLGSFFSGNFAYMKN